MIHSNVTLYRLLIIGCISTTLNAAQPEKKIMLLDQRRADFIVLNREHYLPDWDKKLAVQTLGSAFKRARKEMNINQRPTVLSYEELRKLVNQTYIFYKRELDEKSHQLNKTLYDVLLTHVDYLLDDEPTKENQMAFGYLKNDPESCLCALYPENNYAASIKLLF